MPSWYAVSWMSLHLIALSPLRVAFPEPRLSLVCKKKETKLIYLFLCLDFTTIRRGFMKSQEDSTGKPEDGEQIIRYWWILSLSARFEWWIAPGYFVSLHVISRILISVLHRVWMVIVCILSQGSSGWLTFTFHQAWMIDCPNDCLHTQTEWWYSASDISSQHTLSDCQHVTSTGFNDRLTPFYHQRFKWLIAGELLRKLLVDYPQYLLSLGDPCFRMNNERFMVPELLFNPSDIGEFFSIAFNLFL